MLLLTGPPASGKTSFCLQRIRECIRAGRSDCRLLTPTTTMAEHLRNELAREGFVFSPKIVSTFGKFLADYVRDLPAVGRPALELLVAEELEQQPLPRYTEVRDFPGFRSALVRAVEEFAGAGGSKPDADITGAEFATIFEATQKRVQERGEFFRAQRLRQAASRIASGPRFGTICITGFFAFTSTELEVIRSLAGVSDLIVALADTPAARPALKVLRTFATEEQRLPDAPPAATRTLFTAPTVETEATEIARRILAERERGLAFRDIGIIVRSEQPFVPALRTALERFGIPNRSYFAASLRSDPTVRFLTGLVDAALTGWDHETSLRVLRMHGSPLEHQGDSFEYKVLTAIPGKGLAGLREAAPESAHPWFDSLDALSKWPHIIATPQMWAERFRHLPSLFCRSDIRDGVSPDQILIWRRQSAALQHFAAAATETANALGDTAPVSCEEFRDALDAALSSAELRIVDRRHDVVHIIDAVEARQWRLKVMFVCGLLEDLFPKHHTEDPILPDDARRNLQKLGIAVRTSVERQEEEQFLFDLAITRATQRLYLSYPLLNAKGEPNLPSFLLSRAEPYTAEEIVPVKPKPARLRAPEPFPIIQSDTWRERLAALSEKLSPSRIERFITCPYSYFAMRTLKLNEPPSDPWERLHAGEQGDIAHKVLEVVCRDGVPAEEAFNRVFKEKCDKVRIPDGYRTESIRLELLHGIRQLVSDARMNFRGVDRRFEAPFDCQLPGGPKIHGQIDRIEVDSRGNAVILDYKYKRDYKIQATVRENKAGRKVQTGLYLIGAKSLGFRPAGMVYLGFRRGASSAGWVLNGLWPELQSACAPSELEEVIAIATEASLEAWSQIRQGTIKPEPYELRDCEYCSYSAMCRIEALEEPAVEVMNAAE